MKYELLIPIPRLSQAKANQIHRPAGGVVKYLPCVGRSGDEFPSRGTQRCDNGQDRGTDGAILCHNFPGDTAQYQKQSHTVYNEK